MTIIQLVYYVIALINELELIRNFLKLIAIERNKLRYLNTMPYKFSIKQ